MNQLRIALLTPEHPATGSPSGIGRYTAVLGAALIAAGQTVETWVVGERLVRIDTAGSHDLGPGPRPVLLRPWRLRQRLADDLARFAPDVIEAPNWGGFTALLGGVPRVVRLSTPVTAIRPRDSLRRALLPAHAAWERLAVRRADLVIADSRAMAELGAQVYGRRAELVIPHALSGTPGPASTGEGVLVVGRLEHRKGTDVLLAAWRLVRSQRPHALLHLVGTDVSGFGASALARWGRDGVTVHGWLDDAAVAMVAADCGIQVVPSRYESFGMTVLEAWRAGLAVVASDAGALPDVVGDAGLIVPSGGVAALAAALVALLDDAARRRQLATLGAARLAAVFTPAAMADASLAAYRLAIARRRSRHGD